MDEDFERRREFKYAPILEEFELTLGMNFLCEGHFVQIT
jgi:hypothetical protein